MEPFLPARKAWIWMKIRTEGCAIRSLLLLGALWSAFAVLASPVFGQDFNINGFHADITIHQDSSFEITETIQVEFLRPRHGIYREIPDRYFDELGRTLKTPIKIHSVTDTTGTPLKYRVTRAGNVIHVRIGDPEKYVTGQQTYVLSYRVQNALLFLEEHDELYWNVTGNFWPALIETASADVRLTAVMPGDGPSTSCYTGREGSREAACRMQQAMGGAHFSTTRPLQPGEGLTISFAWRKGLVDPPSAWQEFLWAVNFGENWVFLFPLGTTLFMIRQWRRRGRDPKVREAVTVAYGPPEHEGRALSPAELGTLVDEKVDARDITAAIVGLAVKGYLRIEERVEEGWVFNTMDYVLKLVKEPDAGLTEFERLLLGKIFSDSSNQVRMSQLRNKFYKHLSLLQSTLYKELVKKGYFAVSPEAVRKTYLGAGVVLGGSMAVALAVLVPESEVRIIAGLLTGVPVAILARYMPAKTAEGALAHAQILGFEEFLSRAEKDRLERMGDKNLFSKFLPYAVALDVVDNWSEAFTGIFQEPPQWYTSSRPGQFRVFSPQAFSRSLNTMTTTLGAAMFSAPRGSGGRGGGGSSGRGFGGGGGGSW